MKLIKDTYKKIRGGNGIFLLYLSIFILVVVVLWNRIVSIFKPADDSKREATQLSTQNTAYRAKGAITADGHFINGAGGVTRYTVTQAKSDAESLSALMNTYKGAKWYAITLSFFGTGSVARVKAILNPNYPASYRRYVEQCYRDIFTSNRILQVDVRSFLTGFAGSNYWNNDLTKYFI